MSLTLTQMRKAEVGTVVYLTKAPFVRFKRHENRVWYEVPRHGIKPRILTTSELHLLGVDVVE